MQKWSDLWLLKFHLDKCKVMNISTASNPKERKYYMMVGNEKKDLEIVSEEKDIGVVINRNLSFEQHAKHQAKKADSIMGVIRRNFIFMEEESFKQLYKALVRPHLEYAHTVWSPYKSSIVDCLEDVQRRATRMLLAWYERKILRTMAQAT